MQRLIKVASTSLVIGVHGLVLLTPFVGLSSRVALAAFVSYLLQTFGIMGGYHRYFAHRSFKTSRAFQFVLAWLGCSAMQNGPIWWASCHRSHHRFTDRPGDPHSPKFDGFWHAHLAWLFDGAWQKPDLSNVKDLAALPELRALDRWKWLPTILNGALATAVFGLPGMVWVFGVATTVSFQAPLLVNSLGHMWGTRRFETKDDSRNNFVLALVSLGEGWHNNHHHAPGSARQGFRWWEIDVTYFILRVLERVGVLWAVHPPPPRVHAPKAPGRGSSATGEFPPAAAPSARVVTSP